MNVLVFFRAQSALLGDATAFDLFFGIQAADTEGYLRKVAAHFPKLSYVAMTAREGFSASHNAYKGYLFDGTGVYASQNYDMPDIVDRIGGGDAFMAGLIFALSTSDEAPQYAIDFAAAAAVLKHYISGDFNVSTKSEVEALMNGQTGGRVSR